ncbi:hypothetical protein ACVWWO_001939 [Bradyrhizobium sp. F1.13.1]
MLSKLDFFERSEDKIGARRESEALQAAVKRRLQTSSRGVTVRPVSGGTLGVCFNLEVSGARRFLKTHLPTAQARANLAKEGEILVRLYGPAVVLDRFEVQREVGDTRLCLLMVELLPLTSPMSADEAAGMVRDYTRQLASKPPVTPAWGFEDYLEWSRRALGALAEQSLIGPGTAAEIDRLIALLQSKFDDLPRTLCHGDLGPKNIMTDGNRPIAIDWEDAFWGIAGYDYLYWLTFMDNRQFLRSAAFGRTGLPFNIERAILTVVVLLKSFLSVRSRAHLRHAVPIEARLAEVLELS